MLPKAKKGENKAARGEDGEKAFEYHMELMCLEQMEVFLSMDSAPKTGLDRGSWGVIRSPMVGLQGIVSDGPTHRLPMENRPCKHGPLTPTIPPVSDGVHARMRPTSGLLVLALAS